MSNKNKIGRNNFKDLENFKKFIILSEKMELKEMVVAICIQFTV